MTVFRILAEESAPDQFIPAILPWLHEAGNPYFDWIFGSQESARENLAVWMRRTSAEVSLSRVTLLFAGVQPVGGFLALGGAELARCRLADSAALMKEKDGKERAALLARLVAVRKLFPRVTSDEFYLSKIGVTADLRGKGLGRVLVLKYLADGHAAGFRRFRLDVSAENKPALRLYDALGFRVVHTSICVDGRLQYLSLVREYDAPEDEIKLRILPHPLSSEV